MNHDPEIKYMVVREVIAFKWCNTCNGSGKTERRFQGKLFTDTYFICGGTGRAKVTHRTEVPIREALIELGIIKEK